MKITSLQAVSFFSCRHNHQSSFNFCQLQSSKRKAVQGCGELALKMWQHILIGFLVAAAVVLVMRSQKKFIMVSG